MKKLKIGILVVCLNILNAFADPVSFAWSPNTEPGSDIAGYNLFIAPSVGMVAEQQWFTTNTRITVNMPPGYIAWLTAVNTSGVESWPTNPLQYKPFAVMLHIQSTRQGPLIAWHSVELFRKDETLFQPGDAELTTALSITPDCLKVDFTNSAQPTREFLLNSRANADEFFRALVVAEPR